MHGPLKGARLETWGIDMTTVEAALERRPVPPIALSKPPWYVRLGLGLVPNLLKGRGFLPPGFRSTMAESDDRLPEPTNGLGVIVGREARFYPLSALSSPIEDQWKDGVLKVYIDPNDHLPKARWLDASRPPMQVFSRWYGFAATYPGCGIYERTTDGADALESETG